MGLRFGPTFIFILNKLAFAPALPVFTKRQSPPSKLKLTMRVFQLITALLLAEGVFSEHHKKAEHVGLSRRGIDDGNHYN